MSTLALCMIVKNAAGTLRACLESVSGVVDQIVIADTGSTDATCEIARAFGAVIVDAPWKDHFAEARNRAIRGATTDWILVLDADEELSAEARESISGLLTASDTGGYLVPIWEYVPFVTGSAWTATILPNDSDQMRAKGAPSYLVNTLCRLFRRHDDIYFTGRVHEMVQPQIEAAGMAIGRAPFRIHHYGHLAAGETLARKRLFYNDLLQKRLADDSTDVTTLTMCGLDEWEVYHRPLEALRYFRQALELNPKCLETWLFTAKVLCAMQRYEEALVALDVVQYAEKDITLQCRLRGDALFALGRSVEARTAYVRALDASPDDPLLRAKLDYIEIDRHGEADAALTRLRSAAVKLPLEVEIHELLLNACIRLNRIAEAAEEAERFSKIDRREAFLVKAARLRAQLRQWGQAETLAQECVTLYPDSAGARELLMMAFVTRGRLPDAAREAERLTALVNEPRSYLRAAGIYTQLHDRQGASACLERGLRSFPDSTQLQRAFAESARFHSSATKTGISVARSLGL